MGKQSGIYPKVEYKPWCITFSKRTHCLDEFYNNNFGHNLIKIFAVYSPEIGRHESVGFANSRCIIIRYLRHLMFRHDIYQHARRFRFLNFQVFPWFNLKTIKVYSCISSTLDSLIITNFIPIYFNIFRFNLISFLIFNSTRYIKSI